MERAATRMLAQKLRARNLLETHENNLISHLCTPTIPGSSTRDKSLYSLKPKTLPALSAIGIYQDHASQVTTQSNSETLTGTHKPPPPHHSAKTPTRHPPTSPAHHRVGTALSPSLASWVSSVSQTSLPTDCPPHSSR
jgi:hypothetical protein